MRVAEFRTITNDFYAVETRWTEDGLQVAITKDGELWVNDVGQMSSINEGFAVYGTCRDGLFNTTTVMRVNYDVQ